MGASLKGPKTWTWRPYAIAASVTALALVVAAERIGGSNLWLTPDQRGRVLMSRGRPAEAAEAFRDPLWRGVALFRAGDFKAAAEVLSRADAAEGVYDRGNALVMLGKYEEAVGEYSRALRIHPDWPDALANREIARARAARLKATGGDIDDTEFGASQIVFDKTKKGGADSTVEGAKPEMTDEAIRAIWLKRVQTRPADFLRARFAYQLQSGSAGYAPRSKP
jgi:Ca-activated chloride channel family protein